MSVGRVAIVGAGTMGAGIAQNVIASGIPVALIDADQPAVERARDGIAASLGRAVARGRLSQGDADAALGRLATGTDLAVAADADLVIEAVFEELDVKTALFQRLNGTARPDALVATNTSCLKVDALADAVERPERFLGLHYFSPAQVNPLVEVVRGARTGDAAYAAALAFVAATGKTALQCRDRNGFAINRFFVPFCNEAGRLIDEGHHIGRIERVAQGTFGAAAGPFTVMNLTKARIMLHAAENLEPLGPFYAPAASVRQTGGDDATWPVEAALESSPADDPAAEAAIADRLRGAVFLALLEALAEDVAAPADIDTGARLALRWSSPPCAQMDALGRTEVERLVRPLAEAHGADVPQSLDRVGSLIA